MIIYSGTNFVITSNQFISVGNEELNVYQSSDVRIEKNYFSGGFSSNTLAIYIDYYNSN